MLSDEASCPVSGYAQMASLVCSWMDQAEGDQSSAVTGRRCLEANEFYYLAVSLTLLANIDMSLPVGLADKPSLC